MRIIMKARTFFPASISVVLMMLSAFSTNAQAPVTKATVYFTSEITPESLVKIYKALGKEATGKVAVKISTGESAQSNHLRPELIGSFVHEVNGAIVECNTAYGGNRSNTAAHRRAIEQRGYGDIAEVDIMDEEGYIDLPVTDTKYLKYNRVGSHLSNYDFLINLAHFKGHAMADSEVCLKTKASASQLLKGKRSYIPQEGMMIRDMYFKIRQDRTLSLSQWQLRHSLFTITSKGIRFISMS